jgi:hypothetical protein
LVFQVVVGSGPAAGLFVETPDEHHYLLNSRKYEINSRRQSPQWTWEFPTAIEAEQIIDAHFSPKQKWTT